MRKLCLGLLLLLAIGGLQLARPSPITVVPVPVIVAREVLLARTGETPLTTAYIPVNDGVFHIVGYAVFTDPSFIGPMTTYNVEVDIRWTDELQTRNGIVAPAVGGAGYAQGDIVIHALAGQPIQFSGGANPASTTPYNLYFTVVKE